MELKYRRRNGERNHRERDAWPRRTTSKPEREQVVLLLDSGDLRTFDLAAASSIRFADPKLQAQLKDYLTVVNQSRSTDKRSIYIDSSDAKERQIAASYMIPTPVWKSSYRLIFDEKSEPTLEGWAIIDNTTGEDWMYHANAHPCRS